MINYLDDLYAIRDILLNNKIILVPTDSIWSFACHPLSETALNTVKEVTGKNISREQVIITDTIERLKLYVKEIHPRVETLLCFHERPLNILYNASFHLPYYLKDKNGRVIIRITKDELLCDLIKLIDHPLVSIPATRSFENLPKSIQDINSELLDIAGYVLETGRSFSYKPRLAMMISFDKEGELIFHRQ